MVRNGESRQALLTHQVVSHAAFGEGVLLNVLRNLLLDCVAGETEGFYVFIAGTLQAIVPDVAGQGLRD